MKTVFKMPARVFLHFVFPRARLHFELESPDITSSRPRPRPWASAAQVLLVGVICFGTWLFIDARQLYNSAATSPIGTRRSVAMSVLRPIAHATEFVGFDRVVNAANRTLGRSALTPGAFGLGTSPAPVRPGPTTAVHRSVTAPAKPKTATRRPKHRVTTTTTPMSTLTATPLVQPTRAHPLTILAIGDSIGEDLSDGLGVAIGLNPTVHLIQAAVGDTGLADVGYYNWPANLAAEMHKYHPQLVVALFGGNDWQSFPLSASQNANTGTALWRSAYGARVADLMNEVTSQGAQMIWVGLPIMGPQAPFPATMAPTLDSIYEQEAAAHPGVRYFSSWKLFTNAKGQYEQYLTTAQGNIVDVRDSDGVHIALPGGSDLLANAVVVFIETENHIKI